MTDPEIMRCATHPDVETTLKCGKCGKPICPKCLVQTPVGARCRECAKLYTLPTYRISGMYYIRAAGAALGMAIAIGLAWGFVANYLPYIFLNLIFAAGLGYAVGEVMSLAVNRKRGIWLAVIGGAAFALSYVIRILTFGEVPTVGFDMAIDLAGLIIGVYMAVNRLY
ncbi:MAG: hypothetical protein A2Y58_04435 [Chloroflexi bacterium RBG_13_51_52]|nr:MAG: hypothetical protein A2Y58_04435 [Chloroflexi bacterium RBG_13_51_52]